MTGERKPRVRLRRWGSHIETLVNNAATRVTRGTTRTQPYWQARRKRVPWAIWKWQCTGGSGKCGNKWPFCAPNGEKGQTTAENDKEVDETMRGGWIVGCWADTRHHQNVKVRNLRTEETTEEEIPPQSKRPVRRKGRPADFPISPRTWSKKWERLLRTT